MNKRRKLIKEKECCRINFDWENQEQINEKKEKRTKEQNRCKGVRYTQIMKAVIEQRGKDTKKNKCGSKMK